MELEDTKGGWTAERRRKLAAGEIEGGFAGPDQSFPIAGPSDVGDAWGLAGHAASPDAVRRKIISIAKRHGWTSGLPAAARKWAEEHGVSLGEKSIDADPLVIFGGEIKALGDGKVGGYLVRFTDAAYPDLEGDFFDKSSDLDIDTGDAVTLYYNHGFDPVLKRRKLGKGTVTVQDVGVWVEAQLQMRDEYEKAIYALAEQGKLGWSSGAPSYLVERESKGGNIHWIKSWPLGKDASLTPTPAAGPQLTAVQTLKSWAESIEDLQALTQQVAGDATTHSATVESDEAVTDTSSKAKSLLLELELLAL